MYLSVMCQQQDIGEVFFIIYVDYNLHYYCYCHTTLFSWKKKSSINHHVYLHDHICQNLSLFSWRRNGSKNRNMYCFDFFQTHHLHLLVLWMRWQYQTKLPSAPICSTPHSQISISMTLWFSHWLGTTLPTSILMPHTVRAQYSLNSR